MFNSQLLSKPDGKMALVVPQECRENTAVATYLAGLIAAGDIIDELLCFELDQSMRNGGGPACLRLRVVLSGAEAAAMHQGVIVTESLYIALAAWIERHYRDRLSPQDLADPAFAIEVQTAMQELSRILAMPELIKK